MVKLSNDLAEKYYGNILGIHNLGSSLRIKVPILKNEIEEMLTEITGIHHFKPKYKNGKLIENGQKKWLENRQIRRKPDGETGEIPISLVTGIINLFEYRNDAEHPDNPNVIDKATYDGLFAVCTKAISFFSEMPVPDEIQAICNGNVPKTNVKINNSGHDTGRDKAREGKIKTKSKAAEPGDFIVDGMFDAVAYLKAAENHRESLRQRNTTYQKARNLLIERTPRLTDYFLGNGYDHMAYNDDVEKHNEALRTYK